MTVNDGGEYMSDGGTTYMETFNLLEVSEMCLHKTKQVREEDFTTMTIKLPGPQLDSTICALRPEIDSGASGNVLPMRTLKQMYGENELQSTHILPTPWLKMKSYSRRMIWCHGKIIMPCQ